MKSKHYPRQLSRALAAGLLLSCSILRAQTTRTSPSASEDEVVRLMTYTVTADDESGYYSASALTGTRTQTALSDLAMTVNVVTSELMSDIGAIRLEDALIYTPGVDRTSDFESNLVLRGFRETTPRFNGVPTLNTSRWDSAMIDRVEVLKGPSAALYGSTAAAGGFVNVITKKPQFKSQRSLTLTAGTMERYRASLDVTGPLAFGQGTAKFAYRVIGVLQEGSNNGWRDFAGGERRVISPSLTWRPAQNTEVTLELYSDRYNRVMDVATMPVKLPDQSRLFFNELNPRFNINGPDSFDNYFLDAAFLYITHQINAHLGVRTMSAYLNSEQDFLRRQGFTEVANTPPGTLATFGLNRQLAYDRMWHRVDTQWKSSAPGGKINVLLGLQYSDDGTLQTNYQDTTEPRFNLFNYTSNSFRFNPLSTYRETQRLNSYVRDWQSNGLISYSLFEERLMLFGNYARRLDSKSRSVNHFAGQTDATQPWQPVDDPDDYQFGATFKLTPRINIYGVIGSDIRLNSVNNEGVRLPNIVSKMKEVGLKLNMGSRLNGSIALFDISMSNLARRDFSQPSQPLTASGTEQTKGAEVELYVTPVDNLDVVFGYSYLDATLASNVERPDLVGTPLQNTPRNSVSFWSRYKFNRGAVAGLSVGLGLVYRGERNPFGTETAQNRALAVAPEYAVFRAMARYVRPLPGGKQISTQLSLNNLTDEKYLSGNDFAAPFNADLSVTYRF